MLLNETSHDQRQIGLLALLIVNIVASVLHYTDNLIHFDAYPEPDWFSPYLTDSIWWLMTPFGLAGFWFYRQRRFQLAYIGLYGYALLSQLTLGHYVVAPIWELSLKMNSLILLESWVAIPIALFGLWSQFGLREGQSPSLE
jgi:hypothetical protein